MTTRLRGRSPRQVETATATATPTEEPHYESLARLIHRATAEALRLFNRLRAAFFGALGQPEPTRARAALKFEVDEAALDAAIQAYLDAMAGPVRTAAGFAEGEGLIQQVNGAGYLVGVRRGAEQVQQAPPADPLTASIQRHLNQEAFTRLSENGQLKFAGRLDEIRDRLVAAAGEGENPIAVARELSKALDLEQARLETLCRTETAFASEAGIRDEYRAAGVLRLGFLINPGTDELCTDHLDMIVPIDADDVPPWHPNCLCSVYPVVENEA